MLNKVLIIDDQADQVNTLVETFNNLPRCFTKATANISTQDVFGADLLILDWDLTGSDSEGVIATSIINKLFRQKAIPVIIYTSYTKTAVDTKLASKLSEKIREMIQVVPKGGVKESLEKIEQILNTTQNLSIRVSSLWKPSVMCALDQTLFSVFDQLNNEAMTLLFRQYHLDRENLSTALKELLSDILVSKLEPLNTDLEEQEVAVPTEDISAGYKAYTWIEKMRKYEQPQDGRLIFTGDIFSLPDDKYGIVITPKCDLARPEDNTPVKFIIGYDISKRLLEVKTVQDAEGNFKQLFENHLSNPSDKEYWMQYVPVKSEEYTIIFRFDEVSTYFYSEIKEYTKDEIFKHLIRVREPYLQDLIQGYIKHHLRVGVPGRPFIKSERAQKSKFMSESAKHHVVCYCSRLGLSEVAATNEK